MTNAEKDLCEALASVWRKPMPNHEAVLRDGIVYLVPKARK
jgi:hypothetical protein